MLCQRYELCLPLLELGEVREADRAQVVNGRLEIFSQPAGLMRI